MDGETRQALNFSKRRSKLISEYSQGSMTKREFILNNYQLTYQMSGPYVKVDTFEKALFNYQYYNCMAKYFKMLSKKPPRSKKQQKNNHHYLGLSTFYYGRKDESVKEILEILNFSSIVAYPIETKSKNLDNRLFEIIAYKQKEAVFHSTSVMLKKMLDEKGLYDQKKRNSVISNYINDTY